MELRTDLPATAFSHSGEPCDRAWLDFVERLPEVVDGSDVTPRLAALTTGELQLVSDRRILCFAWAAESGVDVDGAG